MSSTTTLARQLVRDALTSDIREELRLEPIVFGAGHSRYQHSRSYAAPEEVEPEKPAEDKKLQRRGMTSDEIASLGRRLRG